MRDSKFNRPKSFGEILDHTFRLSKTHFKDFFMVMLLFMGPVYLLQALIELSSGVNFIRDMTVSENFSDIFMNLEDGSLETEIGAGDTVAGFLTIFLGPMVGGSILLMVDRIRKGEEFALKAIIKQTFSRYGGMLGSTLLFGLIVFAITFVVLIVWFFLLIILIANAPVLGTIMSLLFIIGAVIGFGLLFTRWSFYFGSVVFREGTPGFGRSWRLTKGRAWKTFGLYIVFILIIMVITAVLEMTVGLVLGTSVLYSILTNIALMFTTLIFSVGYAVMFFDLKVRHDADDLKDMIADYDEKTE